MITVYWSYFWAGVGQASGWSSPCRATVRKHAGVVQPAQAQAAAAHSKAPPAHSAGPTGQGCGRVRGGFWEGFGQGLGRFLGAFWLLCRVVMAMLSECNIGVLHSSRL